MDHYASNFDVFNIEILKANPLFGKRQHIAIEQKLIPDLKEIIVIANKYRKCVTVEECVITRVSAPSLNVDISIDDSVLKGKVDFRQTVCQGRLSFTDSTFREDVDFGGAILKDTISFQGCTFQKRTNFNGVSFEKEATFTDCDFVEEVNFEDGLFRYGVDFTDSTFGKRVICRGTLFHGAVELRDSIFKQGIETEGSNLQEVTRSNSALQVHSKQRSKPEKRVNLRLDFSHELNEKLKKNVSRRQILRGVFWFLPRG